MGLSNQLLAQANEKNLLIVTTYESIDKGYSKIIVTENDKLIEQIDLLPVYYKDLEVNQITINKLLVKYRKEGYALISNSRGGMGSSLIVTTYLFEK